MYYTEYTILNIRKNIFHCNNKYFSKDNLRILTDFKEKRECIYLLEDTESWDKCYLKQNTTLWLATLRS